MYKLFLHPTERKSPPLLQDWLDNSPRTRKEFFEFPNYADNEKNLFFSTDLSNPDLLVKKEQQSGIKGIHVETIEVDHCAFEFKFGMDLVNSLNSGLLKDELTRMKRKYSYREDDNFSMKSDIPLYLVIVNEESIYADDDPVISQIDLARAYGIAQDLNIRCVYCNSPKTFAKKVFSLIRTPPKEIDLGQRFVIKSTGSDFNRSLQCYKGVTRSIADCIEEKYECWEVLLNNIHDPIWGGDTKEELKKCFTTESGRFMKANMEKFLRKVSGK